MSKITKMMVVLLVMAALTGAAAAAEQAGDDVDKNIVVLKNWKKVDAETLIAAAKAVPDLIASFRRPPAVRQAVIKTLAKIGAEAVFPLVKMLDTEYVKMTTEQGIRPDEVVACIEVFQNMDRQVKADTVIPALRDLMAQRSEADYMWMVAADVLGAMGPEAVPALKEALARGFGGVVLAQQIGPDVSPAVGRILAAPPSDKWEWRHFYSLALAKPGKEHVPALLDLIAEDEHNIARYMGMVLDRMAPDSLPGVISLFKKEDWYCRLMATKILEMMGPKAKASLPALKKVFNNEKEDIDARVGAARAIARIKGSDPFGLYKKIPDLEQRIIKSTREKSIARRQEFMKREAVEGSWVNGTDTQSDWAKAAWWVYAMATGQNLELANKSIREAIEPGSIGSSMDVNLIRVFMMCRGKSSFFPGRLEPETEARLKEYLFDYCREDRRRVPKGVAMSTKDLESAKGFCMELNDDITLTFMTRDYLALSVLKDDPEYKNKKFAMGDTVPERYNAFNKHFRESLKNWALNGLWYQIGSSSYDYKFYPSYFNLIDLSPDDVVRKRARMFLDIALMEIEQISISDIRGGSKSRPKKGGLGDRLNPCRAMLFGERGSILYHAPLAASQYQPPDAAILIHKLGTGTGTYEIANRHPGEMHRREYSGRRKPMKRNSRCINYAYCTPDYIIGCAMYDPNLDYAAGSEGRWSGVIFRNLAAICLPGYTGEKWNVQSKDVMITQRRAGSHYKGRPKIVFESGFEKVERDAWIFVNNGEAFAGVKIVTGGYFWNEPIRRSLYLKDDYSPIIIQTGRGGVYGSFAKFQEAILKAPLKLDYLPDGSLHKVEYTGPNSSRLEFFMAKNPFILPKIDGKTIDLDLKNNYKSPYMRCKRGSHVVTVRYGTKRWDYDFEKNTITEIKE